MKQARNRTAVWRKDIKETDQTIDLEHTSKFRGIGLYEPT
jgi:hypothetical protein